MRMGRVAVPLVKKYFAPVAKEFGLNPQNCCRKKAAPESVERIIEKIGQKNCQKICCSIQSPNSRADDGGGCGGSRRATGRAGGRGGSTNPVQSSRKRKKCNNIAILNKNVAKRSRSDILSSFAFTEA